MKFIHNAFTLWIISDIMKILFYLWYNTGNKHAFITAVMKELLCSMLYCYTVSLWFSSITVLTFLLWVGGPLTSSTSIGSIGNIPLRMTGLTGALNGFRTHWLQLYSSLQHITCIHILNSFLFYGGYYMSSTCTLWKIFSTFCYISIHQFYSWLSILLEELFLWKKFGGIRFWVSLRMIPCWKK